MSDYKDAFSKEYENTGGTTQKRERPARDIPLEKAIEDTGYEVNKAKRIIIKAQISHDQD